MALDDNANLSPETLELLSWISGRPDAGASPLDEVMLAAFACGVSTPEQEVDTLGALVRSRSMRMRLKEMESELQSMRQTPFSKIPEHSFPPVLTHCMRGAMQASMRLYCRSHKTCLARGWSEIMDARDFEAKSLRALVGSIGQTIQNTAKYAGTAVAFVGNASVRLDEDVPAGMVQSMKALVRQDGALQIDLSLDVHVCPSLNSKAVLELYDPNGGTFPIATFTVGSRVSLEIKGFGEIAGLEAGPLQNSLFRLSLGKSSSIYPPSEARLFASVEGSPSLVAFQLSSLPLVEREELVVELRPEAPLEPHLRDLVAWISVPVGNVMQTVASCPLSDCTGAPVIFRRPLSGVIDGTIECGSVIHVRLSPNR